MRPNNRLGLKNSQDLSYREPVSRIVIPLKKMSLIILFLYAVNLLFSLMVLLHFLEIYIFSFIFRDNLTMRRLLT